MTFVLTELRTGDFVEVTDYVANGSFASLKENVRYLDAADPKKYAVLVRTLDFNRGWNGDYVWINEEAYNFLGKSKLVRGDLVLCNVGSVGIVFEVPELHVPMSLGPNAVVCKSKDPEVIRQKFLYYYFLSPKGQALLEELSGGSTVQPKFNKTLLRNSTLQVPDLAHQDLIIEILGSLDAKIANNKSLTETLETVARTIFKSWFIDFDPVHAKARGEQPEGMDAETAALFPDSFEDSDLGPIPAGWSVTSLTEISEFLNGLALQKFPAVDGEDNLPVIKIPQLKTGIASGSGEASNAIPSKYVVSDGDILFSWSGALEVVLWAGGKGALNQHLFKVIPKSFPKWFSLHTTLIHLPEFREIAASKATTMGHIQRGHLSDALCATPNELLLSKATEVLQPLLDASVAHRVENRTLVALRDSLLPRLISGELEIPEELLGE